MQHSVCICQAAAVVCCALHIALCHKVQAHPLGVNPCIPSAVFMTSISSSMHTCMHTGVTIHVKHIFLNKCWDSGLSPGLTACMWASVLGLGLLV